MGRFVDRSRESREFVVVTHSTQVVQTCLKLLFWLIAEHFQTEVRQTEIVKIPAFPTYVWRLGLRFCAVTAPDPYD